MTEALEYAGVPPRLTHCRLENFEGSCSLPEEWGMLTIYGPVGSGKSHLAVGLLAAAIENGTTPGATTRNVYEDRPNGNYLGQRREVGALFADIQEAVESLKPGREDPDQNLRDLLNAELLVFDDFGVERPTEFVLDRVSLILRHRYNYLLRTIITTNLIPSQLNDIDPRLASRMLSDARIKREGQDHRFKPDPLSPRRKLA